MLIEISLILVLLWLLGFLAFPTLGAFIHILLVIAIIMVLIRVIRGENPLK